MNDATTLYLVVAAIAATTFLQIGKSELQDKLNTCNAEYKGFRDGVIYGK
ncbi:MAG: hypothetical protein KME29_03790 [Calothrix sp. FI2-JRJ7]|jgi:hypothetical protein|nr:hypothetical protein [Calothrix sp. FI2-JRJ7]MBW4598742.1 hypothetical protein [Calothrix sp. FI2-JRJ7]